MSSFTCIRKLRSSQLLLLRDACPNQNVANLSREKSLSSMRHFLPFKVACLNKWLTAGFNTSDGPSDHYLKPCRHLMILKINWGRSRALDGTRDESSSARSNRLDIHGWKTAMRNEFPGFSSMNNNSSLSTIRLIPHEAGCKNSRQHNCITSSPFLLQEGEDFNVVTGHNPHGWGWAYHWFNATYLSQNPKVARNPSGGEPSTVQISKKGSS